MKKTGIFLVSLIFITGSTAFSRQNPDGIKALEHVRYLASDALHGRKAGTPDYQKAAAYVAGKMKEYGLVPGGESGSYYQQVLFKNWRNFSPPTRLDIFSPKIPSGKLTFHPGRGRDFVPISGTGSGIVRAKLVFAGYGLISYKKHWDDYQNLEAQGHIVVLLQGVPEFLKDLPKKDISADAKIKTAVRQGAAGLLFIKTEDTPRRRYSQRIKKGVCPKNFVVMTAEPYILDAISELSGISWRDMASRTLREKKSFTSLLDITIEMEAHFIQEDRHAPNVIGFLPGKDPERKSQYILIGAHLDHLGVGLDGSIYNGADDNAASVAVILELARTLHQEGFSPDRTIVFITWAGEELGLVGSRFYTKHPLYPLEKTAIYINMDMVGTGDKDLYVGGMWEFSEFYALLKKHLQPEIQKRLHYRIHYRGSDHSAFLPKGVTAISLRSGNILTRKLDDEHPEYHRPGDEASTIRPELLESAAEYNREILEFLANCKNNLLLPKYHMEFLHKDAFIADMHCDTIGRFLKGADLRKDNTSGHIDIPKLKKGAVDLQVFACFVAPPKNESDKAAAAKTAFDQIEAVHELVEQNPNDLCLIKSYQDIRLLTGTRKIGALIGIEGGYAIEDDLRLLRSFYRSGVRLMTLTHWLDTDWADASGDPKAQLGGLTDFGKKVVLEMNKLGMIIDVSHSHDETFWDVLEVSKDPVIASHSCCRALSNHHRNLSDAMLKALAKKGGLIGINFAPGFLDAKNRGHFRKLRSTLLRKYNLPEDRKAFAQANADLKKRFQDDYDTQAAELQKTLPPIDVRTVVNHIDHVIKVTGSTDYVGLGSDFDGIGSTPIGLENTGKLSNITAEMVRRGYKEKDIRKILGGNFLRILKKVCDRK